MYRNDDNHPPIAPIIIAMLIASLRNYYNDYCYCANVMILVITYNANNKPAQ